MPPSRWCWLVAGPVLLHLAWGLARVPGKVVGRRLEDVQAFATDGDAAALFAANGLGGADVIAWVRAVAPPHTVVLWRGSEVGAIEFAAALLWPRLVVDAAAVGGAGTHAGRAIATATLEGRHGRIVLMSDRKTLRVGVTP